MSHLGPQEPTTSTISSEINCQPSHLQNSTLLASSRDDAIVSLETLLASLAPGGRDFERLCKWVLENVPEYAARLERVWLWDEWPGAWG